MTATDDPLVELDEWLQDNWDPDLTLREWWTRLGGAGWSAASWPVEWFGKGLTRADNGRVSRAIRDFGAVPSPGSFGVGLVGPTVLAHGTDDQKARHLPSIVTGALHWCQLFSEPNAGSDLAGLQTRAERDGDEWVVNGQKVWTSTGQYADKAMLLARTNVDVPKHAGISYFLIDMHQPGIETRPLREMTGRSFFNEVFLTNARVAHADLLGGEGNGWTVANTTLLFERAGAGEGGAASGARPGTVAGDLDRRAGDFVAHAESEGAEPDATSRSAKLAAMARQLGRDHDPVVRQGLARLHTLEQIAGMTALRARALQQHGGDLPGIPNLAKMAQSHGLRLGRDLTFAILGPAATLHGYDPEAVAGVEAATGMPELDELVEAGLFAQGPPIYGGSDQIQRNIVGERVLGLGREPGPDKNTPFRDLPKN